MSSDTGFTIEGWAEFVENFSKLVDKWAEKKEQLLNKLGMLYQSEVVNALERGQHDDTSTLKHSFKVYVFGNKDYVEVGTNLKYALYLNDGHMQHKRLLPVSSLTVKGKSKNYNTVQGKDGTKFVTLRERYIPGVYFMEEAERNCRPRWERAVHSFMEQLAREVEGGKL